MLDAHAGLFEGALVVGHDPVDVGAKQHGADLENELIDVGVGLNFAGVASLLQGLADLAGPMALEQENAIAGAAGLAGELRGDGGEEATAREDALAQMLQEGVRESHQSRYAFERIGHRSEHILDEDLGGGVDRRQFQFFLRFEVSVEPAFAHADLVGEFADREDVESAGGGEVGGGEENRLAAGHAIGAGFSGGVAVGG